MERILQKGSRIVALAFSDPSDFIHSLHGRNFKYRVLGGQAVLRIDMSANLRVRNKQSDQYHDACEFMEEHARLNLITLSEPLLNDFARVVMQDKIVANKHPSNWLLELDFSGVGGSCLAYGKAEDFLYAVSKLERETLSLSVHFRGPLYRM